MTATMGRRAVRLLWMCVLPVLLLYAYNVYATGQENPFFPDLGQLREAVTWTWTPDALSRDAVPSLLNLARGYLIGFVSGVLIGVVLGRVRTLRRAADPVIGFVLTLPAVALLPVFLLLFGIGQQLQVSIIVFAVVFTVIVMTAHAVAGIEPVVLDMAQSFRIRTWRRLVFVILPSVTPQILSAARITLSLSVLVMVVSEMVGASTGIGATVLLAQQSFDYNGMWAGMVLIAVLGIVLNILFTIVERSVLRLLGLPAPHARRSL